MPVEVSVEREYKGLIFESDYFRLTAKYSPTVVRQTNYYFDTPHCRPPEWASFVCVYYKKHSERSQIYDNK